MVRVHLRFTLQCDSTFDSVPGLAHHRKRMPCLAAHHAFAYKGTESKVKLRIKAQVKKQVDTDHKDAFLEAAMIQLFLRMKEAEWLQ
jgi:hypothetical protein